MFAAAFPLFGDQSKIPSLRLHLPGYEILILLIRSVQEVGLPVGYNTTRSFGGGHDAVPVSRRLLLEI